MKPVGAAEQAQTQGGPDLVRWAGFAAELEEPSEVVPEVTATPGGMSKHLWAAAVGCVSPFGLPVHLPSVRSALSTPASTVSAIYITMKPCVSPCQPTQPLSTPSTRPFTSDQSGWIVPLQTLPQLPSPSVSPHLHAALSCLAFSEAMRFFKVFQFPQTCYKEVCFIFPELVL